MYLCINKKSINTYYGFFFVYFDNKTINNFSFIAINTYLSLSYELQNIQNNTFCIFLYNVVHCAIIIS